MPVVHEASMGSHIIADKALQHGGIFEDNGSSVLTQQAARCAEIGQLTIEVCHDPKRRHNQTTVTEGVQICLMIPNIFA